MENQDQNNQSVSESKSIDFQTLINTLQKLYEYYCQYGERLNSTILKSHKFIKISKEAGIMSNIINKTRLEIIYKSENKYNRMNFEQFLNSLIKIADIKYTNITESRRSKVKRLINEYYIPLYYTIFNGNVDYFYKSYLYAACKDIIRPETDKKIEFKLYQGNDLIVESSDNDIWKEHYDMGSENNVFSMWIDSDEKHIIVTKPQSSQSQDISKDII